MRRLIAGVVLALVATAAACTPSRGALFGPVRDSIVQRTGVEPDWRADWRRSPRADQRVRDLLAEPLTADSAVAIAILGNAELQAAYEELGIAGGALASAHTPPNPHAEAELRFPLDEGETQLEFSVVESVTGLLTLIPKHRAADAELRAARRNAIAATLAVAARARTAYYHAAAAEQILGFRRTIAEAAAASAELARSLRVAGNITELELAREELFEEEASLAVREAEAEAVGAHERVNAALGLYGHEASWRITAALPDAPDDAPAADALEREAVAASLGLEAQRWRIEAAGHRIGVARLESFVPDLGAGVAAKREGDWGAGPVVSLSIPLFDWGQGKRATAWAELRRAQHEYTSMAVDLRAQARAWQARLAAAHERAVRFKTVVLPLHERLLAEAVRQYNAMNQSPFELLVVRREQVEAQARYIEALRDYWVAITGVEQLRAGALPAPASEGSP